MARRPEPVSLHRNGFKFYLAALICLVVAGVSGLTFLQRLGTAAPGDLFFLTVSFVITAPIGWIIWTRARDPRPELVLDGDGFDDGLHGRVSWDDIAGYRLRKSWINAGFGYDLNPGVLPQKRVLSYRIARVTNAMAGLPARSFKKQMMREPPEAFHEAFRKFRPDLDKS